MEHKLKNEVGEITEIKSIIVFLKIDHTERNRTHESHTETFVSL